MPNTVKSNQARTIVPEPLMGDIYQDTETKELYMLACSRTDEYAAISLTDGNRFSDTRSDKNAAVRGLVFFGRNVKITVQR